MTTWRKLLIHALETNGENFYDLVYYTMSDEEMDVEFDGGYGVTEGIPFQAWSTNFVYFPVCYDGAEWVGVANRHPCDVKKEHQGGG